MWYCGASNPNTRVYVTLGTKQMVPCISSHAPPKIPEEYDLVIENVHKGLGLSQSRLAQKCRDLYKINSISRVFRAQIAFFSTALKDLIW